MITRMRRWLARALAVATLTVGALGTTATVAHADILPAQQNQPAAVAPLAAADGTPEGAVQWFEDHKGSTGWQGYCEKAVENAYGTTGVWPSAIAHWNGAGPKHEGDYDPPLGAFVYWNISEYGHVGISDGNGGAYATSVNGAIGHIDDLDYFANYLGWTPGDVPRQ